MNEDDEYEYLDYLPEYNIPEEPLPMVFNGPDGKLMTIYDESPCALWCGKSIVGTFRTCGDALNYAFDEGFIND